MESRLAGIGGNTFSCIGYENGNSSYQTTGVLNNYSSYSIQNGSGSIGLYAYTDCNVSNITLAYGNPDAGVSNNYQVQYTISNLHGTSDTVIASGSFDVTGLTKGQVYTKTITFQNQYVFGLIVRVSSNYGPFSKESCGLSVVPDLSSYNTSNTAETVNIYYDKNGGTGGPSSTTDTATLYSNYIIQSGPTKEHYDFLYWSDGNHNYIPGNSYYVYDYWYDPFINPPSGLSGVIPIVKNTTLVAQYAPKNYTITYNGNEGLLSDGNKIYSKTYAYLSTNALISNPGFIRKGYEFIGWSNTGINTSILSSYTVNKDDILYAVWKPSVYSITYKDIEDLPYSGNNLDSLTKSFVYNVETELIDG